MELWPEFFRSHCDALFQTALLVTADPDAAEASVVATINTVSVGQLPGASELAYLQTRVALAAIQQQTASSARQREQALLLTQNGLWPILYLDRRPRACYVLRVLLGCGTTLCGQALGVETATIKALLVLAVEQLRKSGRLYQTSRHRSSCQA